MDIHSVVVVDDNRRFALYVWRYLSRCIGFGTGGATKDSCPFHGEALPTPDGDVEVWWVNTTNDVERHLNDVLKRTGRSRSRSFLVDASIKSSGSPLSLDEVLNLLDRHDVRFEDEARKEVFLVSSYHTAPIPWQPAKFRGPKRPPKKLLRIEPKSPEMLQRLWKRVHPERKEGRSRQSRLSSVHILVTGAGFEFKERREKEGEESREFLRLGTRWTNDILRAGLSNYFTLPGNEGKGFVCPQDYQERPDAGALHSAADRGNLDSYWDELLRLELEERRAVEQERAAKEGRERPDKGSVIQREYELRESFRHEFLVDDWGFLNQSLDALEVDGIIAWLTTNYTRFADRAIYLKRSHKSRQHWRVVSTSSEAERLLQELLYPQDPNREREAVLFKLHGDLAHLLTMAIAGHDKEIYSPLSLPISSLHPIYTAAEQHLKRRLEAEQGTVFWHIVGHALQDDLLVELVQSVWKERRPRRHCFLVVNPDPNKPAEKLQKKLSGNEVGSVFPIVLKLDANQYLARLRKIGPPESLKRLKNWLRSILHS